MALVSEFRAGDLRDAFLRVAGVLHDHAEALDSLDGFREDGPGSAIASTMAAALEETEHCKDLVSLSSTMTRGARSAPLAKEAWILGELFAALGEVAAGTDVIDAPRLALVLELTAERIQGGPPDPGGLRAVVTASSVGALRAVDQGLSLAETIIAAADEGLDELESGVGVNPRLAADGVVDAAAAAYLLVLDALAAVVTGDPLPQAPASVAPPVAHEGLEFSVRCEIVPFDHAPGSGRNWIDSCSWLEGVWSELGVIRRFDVAGERALVALDTPDPGRAVEALCTVARPVELVIGLAQPGWDEEPVGAGAGPS